MSDIDPEKMKVAELKEELKNRGLDTKGTKAVLAKRLKEALSSAEGNEAEVSLVELDTTTEEANESHTSEPAVEQESVEPEAEPEAQPEKEATNETEAAEEPAEEKTEEPVQNGDGQGNGEAMEGQAEGSDQEAEGPPEGEEFETVDDIDDENKPGEKRKRSRSRDRHRKRSRSPRKRSPVKVIMDDDTWESETTFKNDRFNADLNLRIMEDGLKAHPLTVEGFGFMWAGCRAMYGVTKGKVSFEVKMLENLQVDHLPEEETNRHVCRVGWSTDSTTLQLGEEPLSWGFGGTGKASTDCKFENYGEKFTAGDVITAYVDLDSEPATMSFSKNGNDLGNAYEIDRATLGDQAVFPHVLSKNVEFEVNYGALEEPWFPLKEEYIFCETVDAESRVRGALPPAKKEECEIIMMVGLPGAGKTHWATKHNQENADKKYNVLGTNNIIDKMKVMGLPRKKNYAGRWDVLIDKSTKCLNRMIEIAARKKRNYILDQTNVYASARRRKMAPFEGFQRKAVVIVPTEEEFKNRTEQREKDEGKEVPEKAILEMKANFTLPEKGNIFDEVDFIELEGDDLNTLLEGYVKEGKAACPPRKRFRGGFSGGRDNYRGGYRDRRDGGRGSYSGGGGRSGGGGGGYRDNRRDFDNRDKRRDSGRQDRGYGGGQKWGGGGGRQGGQGSWGNQQSWGGGNQGGWGNQSSWGNQQSGGYGNQGNWGGSYGNQGYGSGQQWGSGQQQGSWGQQSNYRGGYNQQSQGYGGGQWGSGGGYNRR